MPVYEYECAECGDFTAVRPMAQYQDPHECPVCGQQAQRVLRSAPSFAAMPAATRQAHAVNERSAHAPRSSSQTGAHKPGCGCCSGVGKSRTVQSADGKKAFPDKRPWMISH